MSAAHAVPSATTCPQCGSRFDCGMSKSAEGEVCWCARLPPLARLEPGTGCLCPKCLDARLAAAAGVKEPPAGLC